MNDKLPSTNAHMTPDGRQLHATMVPRLRFGEAPGPWRKVGWSIVYWGVSAWLALGLYASVSEIFSYHENFNTYRRVFVEPERYLATIAVHAALFSVGAVAQAMRWRSRRISVVALGTLVLNCLIVVADLHFGINRTCCG